MKLKIREIFNTVAPKYNYWGNKNIFSLTVKNNTKYTILYSTNLIPVQYPSAIETPQIQNYSLYTILSNQTISATLGCATIFGVPVYTFPSWDVEISQTPGITFGKIVLSDFFTITSNSPGSPSPNASLTCS